MNFPFFSSPSLVGLDIQPRALRLVKIKKCKRRMVIECAASASLPEDIFYEGKISGWASLETIVSGLVHQLDLQGEMAAVSLPAGLVRVQTLSLPCGLPEAAIEMEIHAHVQRDFPGMTEALSLDFVRLPSSVSGDIKILFAAVRQEYVSQYLDCLKAAGLRVIIADVDIFALQRAVSFGQSRRDGDQAAAAVLYSVDEAAHLAVFYGPELLFHSSLGAASPAAFSTQLTHQLQICRAASEFPLDRLALCVGRPYFAAAEEAAQSMAFAIDYPDPFAHLQPACAQAAEALAESRTDYLIACGLALREVKSW